MTTAVRDRVLVVDDEQQVLVALEDLLSDDFTVVKTQSIENALNMALSERDFAVVISDQRMPKMTGAEFFSRLDGHSDATRILVTGFADLSAVINAVNNGRIFAYVTKPWNPEDLRLMVHKGADYFRLAQELVYERQLLHDLMDNVPDGIYFKDLDLRFLRANRSYAALLDGADPERLVGKKLSEIEVRDPRSVLVEAEERRILSMNKPSLDVVRARDRHGQRRWVSESKAPIRNPNGETIGLVGISRDVTQRVTIEEALRTSEERLALTFQGSAAGLFDWNVISGEVSFSASFAELLGYAEASWSESLKEVLQRVDPSDLPRLRQAVGEHFRTRKPFNNLEIRVRVRTGEYHWFVASGQAVWNESGTATRLAGSIADITDRKRQDERITRLTRIHAVLGEISSAIVRTSDRGELIRESCRIAVDIGQLALAIVARVDPDSNVALLAWEKPDSAYVKQLQKWLSDSRRTPSAVVEELVVSRHPVIFNDLASMPNESTTDIMLAHGYRALAVFPFLVAGRVDFAFALFSEHPGFFDSEEVTLLTELAGNMSFALEHVAQAERLNFLAYHDGLTTLPNKDLLTERLAVDIGPSGTRRKVALVLVDVGRFGRVNETLGRNAGDQLLVQIAARLEQSIPQHETLARVHGNTFAIVIGSVEDESDVALFVEKEIEASLRSPFTIEGTELRVSVRSGIALYPSDGHDPDTLIRNAEAALRNAKSLGQRYMFYAPTMNARVSEKLTLETKLRRAIDRQEFLLFYQPKVDFKTKRVVGLEALLRWLDPDVGLVAPGQFVPVLEDTGLILDVGRWVLAHAAAQYTAWRSAGLNPPRIAVNVSAMQLAQPDFVESIDATLRLFPLAAEGLDLEITESVFVDNLVDNAEKLRRARERGLGVAIDDFGTGYSSLGYLSRLPIDALKIDRSFVIRMLDDPHDTAIVTTIISLARALDLKVIAEGVETPQQAQLLRLLKCDQLQGYLASKPLPAEDAVRFLGTTLTELSPTAAH